MGPRQLCRNHRGMRCQQLGCFLRPNVGPEYLSHCLHEHVLGAGRVRELMRPHEMFPGGTYRFCDGDMRATCRTACQGADGRLVDGGGEVRCLRGGLDALEGP
eukprot:12313872-Heterocapsa_arctica.AAC.1